MFRLRMFACVAVLGSSHSWVRCRSTEQRQVGRKGEKLASQLVRALKRESQTGSNARSWWLPHCVDAVER